MPRPLEVIRANIDALDQQIVTSLFENGSNEEEEEEEEEVFESRDIKAEEIAQIRALQLRFSAKTWSLINQRMVLSKEVADSKKGSGKVVVDEVRKEKVITQAQSQAPGYADKEIRKLYELIHAISVRIQNEIIGS